MITKACNNSVFTYEGILSKYSTVREAGREAADVSSDARMQDLTFEPESLRAYVRNCNRLVLAGEMLWKPETSEVEAKLFIVLGVSSSSLDEYALCLGHYTPQRADW